MTEGRRRVSQLLGAQPAAVGQDRKQEYEDGA